MVAHLEAIQLAQAWVREEQRHRKTSAEDSEVFPADPATLPAWTGLPPIEAQGGIDWLAVPPENLPGDEVEEAAAPSVSLQRACDEFLERARKKADRDARSCATHWWYEREFHLGLVAGAIDATMPVSGITRATVEAYCEFWTDLNARAAENPRKRSGGGRRGTRWARSAACSATGRDGETASSTPSGRRWRSRRRRRPSRGR